MARNTSLSLGEHFEQFIGSQIESGRCGSACEVVRSGLRLLETDEGRPERVRKALIEGERSGAAGDSLESLTSELDAESR